MAEVTATTLRLAKGEALAQRVMTGGPVLRFSSSNNTITRVKTFPTDPEPGSWLKDGFAIGQQIKVESSEFNDGIYTVTGIDPTGATLTLAPLPASDPLTDFDEPAAQVSSVGVSETLTRREMSGTPSLTFNDNGAQADTIMRSAGSWAADGFAAGQVIRWMVPARWTACTRSPVSTESATR